MGVRKNKSLLDQATETMGQYADQVRPQVENAVTAAREKAGPVLADAKAKAGPALADAKAKAAPVVATGAALAAEKLATGAQAVADMANEASTTATEAAKPKKKGGKLKKLLLITGIAAAAAFVAKKLRGGNESQNWQSSYTPTPAPQAADEDPGGASPAEAIADQAETPHPATTPDDPASVVDVDKNP